METSDKLNPNELLLENKPDEDITSVAILASEELKAKPPSGDSKPPSVDAKPPSADAKPRSADGKPPSADTKPPSADGEPPSADAKPTVHDNKIALADGTKPSRIRMQSEPAGAIPPVRRVSIIKTIINPEIATSANRKCSEGNVQAPRRRISFVTSDPLLPPREGYTISGKEDVTGDSPDPSKTCLNVDDEDGSEYFGQEKRESLAFLQVVGRGSTPRHSCTSLAWRNSRASFAAPGGVSMTPNLSSRPSIASLKETISRVNLELHPEKGSFVAYSMGQSMASIPTIAAKVYIITQVLAALSVSIGSMTVGFTSAWTSPALASMNQINSSLSLTSEQTSWVGSLMPLSALTGSILGGYLIDAIGRKMLICFCGPPFVLAYVLLGSANHVWMLYVGRSLAGLCVGFLTLTLPVYLGETIQAKIRGTLGLLPTTLGNGGILICYLVGAYVKWSTLSYIGAIIPGVFLIMMIFVPETPRWYITKNREEDAYRSLCWLRGTNADVDVELQDIILNQKYSSSNSSSYRDLFSKEYFKPFAIAMALMTFQQLSGINAVIFYSASIFKSVDSTLDSNLCTIIIGVVNLLSTLLATVLIDRLGRKILLHMSNVLMIVSLISLTIYFYLKSLVDDTDINNTWGATVSSVFWLPLVCLMLYVTGFSLGWGPIPWLFMGEALPSKIRGPAASIVTALNWGFTFVITKLFPSMVIQMGETGVFAFFTCVMVFATVFTIIMVPETKGMSLEEIEAAMMGRKKPSLNRKLSEVSGIMLS